MGPAGGGGGGGRRPDRRRFVWWGRLPVAGFVAAECLVGGEGLIADGASVGELKGRWGGRRRVVTGGRGGVGSSTCEHDEAEGKVFLFGGDRAVLTRALGAGPLGPWLDRVSFRFVD